MCQQLFLQPIYFHFLQFALDFHLLSLFNSSLLKPWMHVRPPPLSLAALITCCKEKKRLKFSYMCSLVYFQWGYQNPLSETCRGKKGRFCVLWNGSVLYTHGFKAAWSTSRVQQQQPCTFSGSTLPSFRADEEQMWLPVPCAGADPHPATTNTLSACSRTKILTVF